MVEKEIDSLCNQYGLKPTSLSDLMLKVNFPDPDLEYGFTEEENSLYLPLYEELNALSSLSGIRNNSQVYLQLVLDPGLAFDGVMIGQDQFSESPPAPNGMMNLLDVTTPGQLGQFLCVHGVVLFPRSADPTIRFGIRDNQFLAIARAGL